MLWSALSAGATTIWTTRVQTLSSALISESGTDRRPRLQWSRKPRPGSGDEPVASDSVKKHLMCASGLPLVEERCVDEAKPFTPTSSVLLEIGRLLRVSFRLQLTGRKTLQHPGCSRGSCAPCPPQALPASFRHLRSRSATCRAPAKSDVPQSRSQSICRSRGRSFKKPTGSP